LSSSLISPRRIVQHGDGVAFLRRAKLAPGSAIVTSLPDASELPELGFEGWRAWFIEVAQLCCEQVSDNDVAIFYQTDIKLDGHWVDKAFLVQTAAEQAKSRLLFHKIACRRPAGDVSFGRPAYGHLLCFSRTLRLALDHSFADVLPQLGEMAWPRAMGREVCEAIARFLTRSSATDTVVDPFCGHGAMLAVANAHGLHSVGVERSKKRAKKALLAGEQARSRPRGKALAGEQARSRPRGKALAGEDEAT
jgi:hypothetical protein